jgi:hypothetical protein
MEQVQSGRLAAGPSWAAMAPLLCVAHCLAAPLLLLVAPVLAENAVVESVMMGVSVVVAVLFTAYGVRRHAEMRVVVPLAAGMGVWAAAVLDLVPVEERVLTVAGGLAIALALVWNARLTHAATCRSCTRH